MQCARRTPTGRTECRDVDNRPDGQRKQEMEPGRDSIHQESASSSSRPIGSPAPSYPRRFERSSTGLAWPQSRKRRSARRSSTSRSGGRTASRRDRGFPCRAGRHAQGDIARFSPRGCDPVRLREAAHAHAGAGKRPLVCGARRASRARKPVRIPFDVTNNIYWQYDQLSAD